MEELPHKYNLFQEVQDRILKDYADDFGKHTTHDTATKVRLVWDAIPSQIAKENNKKIGSYSIGILPKFRKNGIAKEAVAKVIKEKAKSVDRVVSYIKKDNIPSKKLAQSLNIPIIEEF